MTVNWEAVTGVGTIILEHRPGKLRLLDAPLTGFSLNATGLVDS